MTQSLSAVREMRLRRRLDATARPCGCRSGAALSLMAIVAFPAWALAAGAPSTVARIALLLAVYPVVVVAAGVVGKLAGIAVGRARHARLRRILA